MSFSLFKKAPSLSFVFDIRDTSISIAAARFEIGKKPEIVLCKYFELKYQDLKDNKKYIASMIRTLDRAIVSIRRELILIGNKDNINKYYFFIGSPWCVSQAKTIKIIKDRQFEVNNSVLEKIIIGEEYGIERLIEEQTLEPNWKVLEEKIIQSKLDGYKVDKIFGKKTKNLAIELFVSFIPYEIKDKLDSYMKERIGNNVKRQNNSSTLSSYSFFRDLYSNKNDFIYINISQLITDIYVVRDDVIFAVASMPYGEENIIQSSLEKSNLSRGIFLSHINIGQDKKFDLAAHNNGEDLLKPGFDIWESELKKLLSKICTEMNIPNILFIIPNSVISGLLIKGLSKKEKSFEILDSKIEISPISEGILNSFILNGKSVVNEPYIKMHLVFLDKIFKEQ